MIDWLASLTFGSLMVGAWSVWAMFMLAAIAFGFEEVVAAIGGAFDRIGLRKRQE